jgi:Deoxycytidylate deaminase
MTKIVIGFVGSFGSGCSYLSKRYIVPSGFKYISLSEILRDEYQNPTIFENDKREPNPTREMLQEFGDKLRKEKVLSHLAQKANELIQSEDHTQNWVVDSFRHPAEIDFFRATFPGFYLFSIYADYETRWLRVKQKYKDNQGLFDEDDRRDQDEPFEYGQKVRDCFLKADIALSNNTPILDSNEADKLMATRFKNYLSIIEEKIQFVPSEAEALMVIAYANSIRSSCKKRKVGAVLVDIFGQVFSTGFNEVPKDSDPCEKAYGKCYRDYLRNQISTEISSKIKDLSICKDVNELIKSKYKNLDYCRALHAEEQAILSVARTGSSLALRGSHLYSTTYPCNLCANKIAQVGIKQVIYLEPYPMLEAKKILAKNMVDAIPFEGVLFNGYFRFFKGGNE